MELELFPGPFCICKLAQNATVDLSHPFCFYSATDNERSLVCPESSAPDNALAKEDDYFMLRIKGTLDFSLVGILAKISACLAEAGIGIFVVSTFDTDYFLIKNQNRKKALKSLTEAGHIIIQT